MTTSNDEPDSQLSVTLDNLKVDPQVPKLDSLQLEPKQSTTEFAQEREPLTYVQERTRANLAKGLVYGFIGSVGIIFLIIVIDKFFYYTSPDKDKFKEQPSTKDLITLVLTTQSTLVAAAIGFYFGTRDTK